ncbi:protein eva-1 homolog C-like [Clupea harengus]|uniref:Protein eva-1 homolog C-like n=1 Tax=Clupea harengus TaxID=7950 RepID=A0A8M1KK60_CLUHA|nr:protein eva-1 homolog C-like [Clupea harengus]
MPPTAKMIASFNVITSSIAHYVFLLGMLCTTCIDVSQSFEDSVSGYQTSTQRNYSELACDGELLSVRCPPRSTISVQSAFYGRRASIPLQCVLSNHSPSAHLVAAREDVYCTMQTALQKVLYECQDRRSCHLPVSSRVFGTDPCPSHSKYLIVWYKCRPNDYRTKVVCEGERMRLSCRRGTLIAVSSAVFGGSPRATHQCLPPPDHLEPAGDCQSESTLQVVTSYCHGKGSCSFLVSSQEFGEACSPNYHYYLSIIYTCGELHI